MAAASEVDAAEATVFVLPALLLMTRDVGAVDAAASPPSCCELPDAAPFPDAALVEDEAAAEASTGVVRSWGRAL